MILPDPEKKTSRGSPPVERISKVGLGGGGFGGDVSLIEVVLLLYMHQKEAVLYLLKSACKT